MSTRERSAAEEVFGKAHVAERIDLRRRKSPGVVVLSRLPTEPASSPPPTQVTELALRGLRNLGFCATDARRAVDHVAQRRVANGDALDLPGVIRGALAALT
jgi:Holliday junction resolvasome RuvABC DNA-binding subunit